MSNNKQYCNAFEQYARDVTPKRQHMILDRKRNDFLLYIFEIRHSRRRNDAVGVIPLVVFTLRRLTKKKTHKEAYPRRAAAKIQTRQKRFFYQYKLVLPKISALRIAREF